MRYIKSYFLEGLRLIGIDVTPSPYDSFIYAYLIKERDDEECVIVDPGPASSYGELVSLLKKFGCKRLEVFLTHIHIDHSGSAGHLANIFKDNIRVYVHPRGSPHLSDPERLWRGSIEVLGELADIYQKPLPINEEVLRSTQDEEEVSIGDLSFSILHTPGHAPHHQSIYIKNFGLLFPGESAGLYLEEHNAYLIASPPPFKYDMYMSSLNRLVGLGSKYVALPHNTVSLTSHHIKGHLEQLELWKNLSRATDFNEFLHLVSTHDSSINKLMSLGDKMISLNVVLNLRGAYTSLKNLGNS